MNLETTNWTLGSSLTSGTIASSDLCNTFPLKKYVMFPEKIDIDDANDLCSTLGN